MADLLARKVLSARKKKPENNVGNAITRAVGGVFDGMAEGLNHTVLRGHQIEHHAMARISAVCPPPPSVASTNTRSAR